MRKIHVKFRKDGLVSSIFGHADGEPISPEGWTFRVSKYYDGPRDIEGWYLCKLVNKVPTRSGKGYFSYIVPLRPLKDSELEWVHLDKAFYKVGRLAPEQYAKRLLSDYSPYVRGKQGNTMYYPENFPEHQKAPAKQDWVDGLEYLFSTLEGERYETVIMVTESAHLEWVKDLVISYGEIDDSMLYETVRTRHGEFKARTDAGIGNFQFYLKLNLEPDRPYWRVAGWTNPMAISYLLAQTEKVYGRKVAEIFYDVFMIAFVQPWGVVGNIDSFCVEGDSLIPGGCLQNLNKIAGLDSKEWAVSIAQALVAWDKGLISLEDSKLPIIGKQGMPLEEVVEKFGR